MSFHRGQLVVCTHPGPWTVSICGETMPIKGRVYTIRDTGIVYNKSAVRLIEIINPVFCYDGLEDVECWFAAHRFRPVVEDRLAVFRKLLCPVPKQKAPPVPAAVG